MLTDAQAGVVVFDGQTMYTTYEQWCADVDRHRVPPGTPYSWQPGEMREGQTLLGCVLVPDSYKRKACFGLFPCILCVG